MKKYFMLIAAATTVLVVSCHKKEAPAPVVDPTEVEDNTPVPIQFGVNSAIAVKGNVSTKAAIDEWHGAEDTLYVYGIDQTGAKYINNVAAASPDGNGASPNSRQSINVYNPEQHTDTPAVYDEPFYYVDKNVYSFYGYYIGKATYAAAYTEATATGHKPKPDETTLQLPVTIDGTNDIMLATTDKMADIAYAGGAALSVNPADVYSAKAARKSIHPDLIFEHQLSRFVIKIKKGGSTTAAPFKVDSIKVKSKDVCTLDILHQSTTFSNSDPGGDDAWFKIRKANGDVATSAGVHAGGTSDGDGILDLEETLGESVMVSPGADTLFLKIKLSSDQVHAGIPEFVQPIAIGQYIDTPNPSTYVSEAGKKYIVHLTIYGPEAITVTVTLVDWDEVEMDPVDPDVDTRPEVTITSEPTLTATLNTPVALDFTATYLHPQNGETAVPADNITVTSGDTRKATVAKNGSTWEVTGKQAGKVCNVYISVAANDNDPFQSKMKAVKVYIPAANTLAVESGYTTLNTNGVGLAWSSAEFAITKNGGDLSYVYKKVVNETEEVATGLAVVPGTTDDTKFKVTKTNAVAAGTYKIYITSAAVAAAGDNPGVVKGTTTITVVVPAPVANTLAVEDGFAAIELNAAGTAGESDEFAITKNGGALTYVYKKVTGESTEEDAVGLAVVAGTTDDTKFKVTKTADVEAGTYKIYITSAAVAAAGDDPGVAEGTATITVTVYNS